MIKSRRRARDYLQASTLTNFWDIVHEIKVSPEEQRILDARFIDKKSITEIAHDENCSEERINKIIARNYDKISSLMN